MVLFLSILLILVQLSFFLVVILAAATLCAGMVSVYLDVPFVPTPVRFRRTIGAALRITEGDSVYELGSGTGGFLIGLAKKNPKATFIGIELNPLLHAYANVLKRLRGNPSNLVFRRENFFDTDLSGANKIYGYLLESIMERILLKLERETNGVRFASRAFQFKTKQPVDIIRLSKMRGTHGENMLYVYEL